MIRATLISLLALTGAATAGKREAPAYFTDMFAHVYAAETLAKWCPTVSVNPDSVEQAWLRVFARLDADGYDTGRRENDFADLSDTIGATVEAWAKGRNLTGASEVSQVCQAANREMADRTVIGSFLRRTAG